MAEQGFTTVRRIADGELGSVPPATLDKWLERGYEVVVDPDLEQPPSLGARISDLEETVSVLTPSGIATAAAARLLDPETAEGSALRTSIAEVSAEEIANPETAANGAVVDIVDQALAGFDPANGVTFLDIGDDLATARPAVAGIVAWITTAEGGTPVNKQAGDLVFRVTAEPLPYFVDDFARADGSALGSTTLGSLAWALTASVGTPGGVIVSQTAGVSNANVSGRTFATVDAGHADGVFKARLATNDSGAQSLVFRFTDFSNYLFLSRQNSGSQVWSLWRRSGGTATLVFASGTAIATNDLVEVVLNGTSVKVKVNGVEIIDQIVTQQASATRYGFGSVTTYAARWDDVSLDPLPA